jgi:hypothetical protein
MNEFSRGSGPFSSWLGKVIFGIFLVGKTILDAT